jgi:hypothetical protein
MRAFGRLANAGSRKLAGASSVAMPRPAPWPGLTGEVPSRGLRRYRETGKTSVSAITAIPGPHGQLDDGLAALREAARVAQGSADAHAAGRYCR